jgi:hypothetical protein
MVATFRCLFLKNRARGGGSKTQRAVQATLASSPRLLVSPTRPQVGVKAARDLARMDVQTHSVQALLTPRLVARVPGMVTHQPDDERNSAGAEGDHLRDRTSPPVGPPCAAPPEGGAASARQAPDAVAPAAALAPPRARARRRPEQQQPRI